MTTMSMSFDKTGPVMAGVFFKKGEIFGPVVASDTSLYVVVKRLWNDGSVKHGVICGRSHANLPVTFSTGETTGVPLTAASIRAAAPTAVVNNMALPNPSVSLATLLTSAPYRTWVSTPGMVECHYVADIIGLMVWFHVRLWADGSMWIRVVVENPVTIRVPIFEPTYNAQVVIEGAVIKTLTTYVHRMNTAWVSEGWRGVNPNIRTIHNTAYLQETGLVPTYGFSTLLEKGIYETRLAQLPTEHTTGDILMYHPNFNGAGWVVQIGILPQWDVCYIISNDSRAQRSVMAHVSAAMEYAIRWRVPGREILMPSDNPNGAMNSLTGGFGGDIGPATSMWDIAHHPSMGYVAFLISGDYQALEVMIGQCASIYQAAQPSHGVGTMRIFQRQQRTVAWSYRSVAQAAALIPDGHRNKADLQDWLWNNIDFARSVSVEDPTVVNTTFGYPFKCNCGGGVPGIPPTTGTPWQHHHWVSSLAYSTDIDPLPADKMTLYIELRNWMYQAITGLLGVAPGWCYDYAAIGVMAYSDTSPCVVGKTYLPHEMFSSWEDAWAYNYPTIVDVGTVPCSGDLIPHIQSAIGYWATLMPSASYAIKHNYPGAAAAWAQVTTNPEFTKFKEANWSNNPQYGIVFPAPDGPPPPPPPPEDNWPAWRTAMANHTWGEIL